MEVCIVKKKKDFCRHCYYYYWHIEYQTERACKKNKLAWLICCLVFFSAEHLMPINFIHYNVFRLNFL